MHCLVYKVVVQPGRCQSIRVSDPMMANEFEDVENYLLRGKYPFGMEKGEKANLRRRCRNNSKVAEGILYFRKAVKGDSDGVQWRVCTRSEEEKKRIMESCHSGMEDQSFSY